MKRLLILSLFAFLLISCKTQQGTGTTNRKVKLDKTYATASGLQYKYTVLGTGTQAKSGDKVFVHHITKLNDGKEINNTYTVGAPISFVVGAGQVIKGMEEAVTLLCVGDKAVFTIPANLGFGSLEVPGQIPANSVLIFEMELVDIKPAAGN